MTKKPIFALAPLLWGLILPHLTHATMNTATDDALSDTSGIHASALYMPKSYSLPPLPNSSTTPSTTKRYYKVDAGSSLVCAIRNKDRGIDCWGLDDFGQLNIPQKRKFKALSAGENHACAIDFKNKLICWGDISARPSLDQALGSYLEVSSGDRHTCAISQRNGSIKCWGDNRYGQASPPLGRYKKLSVRSNQGCGVRLDGSLSCWGHEAFTSFPIPVGSFSDVSVSQLHACAIRKGDGGLVCWGNGLNGTTTPPSTGKFLSVVSGDSHSCAADINGKATCWGGDRWGQSSGISDWGRTASSLSAGGTSTCLIDENRQLVCRGSFAYNDLLFDTEKPDPAGALKPQIWWTDLAKAGLKGLAGYGLMEWGKSMQDGSKGQKFAFMVGGWLGGKKPDPNIARFKEIQKTLAEVQQQLAVIDSRIVQTYGQLQALSCDTSTALLLKYKDDITAAKTDYDVGTAKVSSMLSMLQQFPNEPVDPKLAGVLDKFASTWDDGGPHSLSSNLNNLHDVLVSGQARSPLESCMNADIASLQTDPQHPFDDRRLYEKTYQLIEWTKYLQLQASTMLQEINARRALLSLTDSSTTPPITDIPEGGAGICGKAKQYASTSPRWFKASQDCDHSVEIVNLTYKRLVQQVEFAGAPYSDENVVLSMGNTTFPHGSSATNWLWLRRGSFDLSEVTYKFSSDSADAYESGLPIRADQSGNVSSINFKNKLVNIYSTGGGDKASLSGSVPYGGVWHGAGQAWIDVYSAYDDYLNKKKKKDLLEMMAAITVPSINDKGVSESVSLFPNIDSNPWWMTGRTFIMEWNRLYGDFYTLNPSFTPGIRCFVAAGVNPTWYYSEGGYNNPKETLWLTGKVCSSEEFAAMAKLSGQSTQKLASYSNGLSYGDNYYEKFINYLGAWFMTRYSRGDLSIYYPTTGNKPAVYFPSLGGTPINDVLYHYPVLDVSKRACLPPLVTSQISTANTRPAALSRQGINGKAIVATRCGADMDRFIDALIPRPVNPPIPESEVRSLQ